MKTLIISIAILITSCSHTTPSRDKEFDYRLFQLESLVQGQGYMLDIDRCQIDYLLCKDKKVDHKLCWKRVEACVSDQYRKNEVLKKKLGH